MNRSNRNFVLAYLLLVALPVLGLAGVLRSGRNLKAPTAIGGVWKLQTNAAPLAAFPCGMALAAPDADFTIAQSGRNFTLNFANSLMSSSSGTIEGATVDASLTPSAGLAKEKGCAGRTLSLVATLDANVSPRSASGRISVNDCADCTSIEFHAIREEQAKAKGGH